MVARAGQPELETWVRNSRLVRAWSDMKSEILRHKWIESERAGADIGWERARVDWMLRHRRAFDRMRPR